MENLNNSDASGLFVNEDSVDIYDGLDAGVQCNAETSPPHASQLKESMDLYEEIVTEEQRSKEASYAELKSRFQAAQDQIKELRRRLEQTEMQNTGLNTENYRLKKNISALLRTARQEVTRKDAEIQRLIQRSEKGWHHHHSHFNNLTDHKSSSMTSIGSSRSRPPPLVITPPPPPLPPARHPPPPLPPANHPPPPLPPASHPAPPLPPASHSLPPLPPANHPPPPLPPASHPAPPLPPASHSLPPLPPANHPPPPLPPASHPAPPLPPASHSPPPPRLRTPPPREIKSLRDPSHSSRAESHSSANQLINPCNETQTSNVSSHSHSKGFFGGGSEIPDKRQSNNKFSSNSSSQHSDSDRHRSKCREKKSESHKLSESTDRRSRAGSHPDKDCHALEKNRCHKGEKDSRRKYDSRLCKSRSYKNEGHHRSDRAKSPPPESLHSARPSDDYKGRSRDSGQDKSKLSSSESEQCTSRSVKEGHSREYRRLKSSDEHSRSSDSRERKKPGLDNEHNSDSSKERDGERRSKDRQRKEERNREDEISRKHRRSALSETSREKRRSKESEGNGREDVRSKERKDNKRSSKNTNSTEESSVVENSPNRKLCFMEGLNLTLSPMKKPVLSIKASQNILRAEDKVAENGSDGENAQCNVEDMCVIDELECSELHAEPDDAAEQSSDITKGSPSSKTHKGCDDAKDVPQKDKSLSQTAASNMREDSTAQTTSAHSQPQNTTENQRTMNVIPKLPESSSPKAIDGVLSNRPASDSQGDKSEPAEVTDSVCDPSGSSNLSQKVASANNTEPTDPSVPDSQAEQIPSVKGTMSSPSQEQPLTEDVQSCQQISVCQEGPDPPAEISSIHKKDACQMEDGPKDTDPVSSTINLESLPQEGLSLPEAIYVLTQTTNDEADDSCRVASEPTSSTGCIAVSKVSSTTEETVLPGKSSGLTFTPKKSFSPGKIHESNAEPSSSVPLLHDEGSMMCTLSNLKMIPDALSPLKSPVRATKRSHLHVHGKPGHVKSLQKDFSSTAVDVNTKKLDINKENKYPGSPANNDLHNMEDKGSELCSSLADAELEEGEISGESDEAASGSPVPPNKRAKLARPVRNKPSPKSVLKRKSEESYVGLKEPSETAGASTRSPKSRFKTVCPAATKASFSTVEEIMETFKLVRSEIRKKYMKLHKTFPKKSFYGMMDNFQESFYEFVDGAHFGQICSQAGELKSKLKKLIASVFSKLTHNGIVKRIFEQQAVDLKQKLWDFVEVQVDCMFKDIHATLKSLCKPARAQAEDKRPSENENVSEQQSVKKPQCHQNTAQSAPASLNQIKPCAVVPYKTGLGSRGKDIRITQVEKDCTIDPHPAEGLNTQTINDVPLPKNIPLTPEKNNLSSLVVSQNGSLLDKTDFELLTEQQASSLTFNLVRDSQMGEIFKCLLQGSDLLETNGITGDSTAWSLGTPKKDGERLVSITTPTKFDSPSKLFTPSKFNTPSKLIATWSSISPRKMSSPRSKDPISLNPAFFDESCLLELPSENKAMLQSSLASQRSYSILTEDLAVSLTIPSPLKSDSHLSFLQPSSMHIMSTPDSVISAHISEDALLDGEDATEQDIHLALDTDNSSCGSSSSAASAPHAASFLFKPDVPMQALVMEKSNDHFIVKIRQKATCADITLTADESLSQTLTEEHQHHKEGHTESEETAEKAPTENNMCNLAESSRIWQDATDPEVCVTEDMTTALSKDLSHIEDTTSKCSLSEESQKLSESLKNQPLTTPPGKSLQSDAQSSDHVPVQISQANAEESHFTDLLKTISPSHSTVSDNSPHHSANSFESGKMSDVSPLYSISDIERDGTDVSVSEGRLTVKEDVNVTQQKDRRNCGKGVKRKKHQDKSKTKRSRTKEVESAEEVVSNLKKDDNESMASPSSLSPNSLSAKNVVWKKGEVVLAWTRDEDRTILIELKKKGASRETFSALAEKLNKPSGQITHRFNQLMKLFKKQWKMDT